MVEARVDLIAARNLDAAVVEQDVRSAACEPQTFRLSRLPRSAAVNQQMKRSRFRASTTIGDRFAKFRCAQIQIVRFRVERHRLRAELGLERLDFREFSR